MAASSDAQVRAPVPLVRLDARACHLTDAGAVRCVDADGSAMESAEEGFTHLGSDAGTLCALRGGRARCGRSADALEEVEALPDLVEIVGAYGITADGSLLDRLPRGGHRNPSTGGSRTSPRGVASVAR